MTKTRGLKILITLLLIAFVATTFSFLAIKIYNKDKQSKDLVTQAWGGSGTESDPYLICSTSDLDTLSRDVANGTPYYGKYFQLEADLDYYGKNFIPIGAKIENGVYKGFKAFSGYFDGNGHMVSNINVSVTLPNAGSVCLGFFACIGYEDEYYAENNTNTYQTLQRDVTVKNLMIYNMSINSTKSQGTNPYVFIGGIAGASYTFTQKITHSSGSYDSTKQIYNIYYSTNILSCVVEDFSVNSSVVADVGGLIGAEITSQSSISGLGFQKLTIGGCIVNDMSVSNAGGLCAVISPTFGNIGMGGWDETQFEQSGYFGYYHSIQRCYTNNKTLVTIYRKVNPGWSDCIIGNDPHPNYTYNGENEYVYRIYNDYPSVYYFDSYDAYDWLVDYEHFDNKGVAYPRCFLIDLNLTATNGKISAKYDKYYYDTTNLENSTEYETSFQLKVKKCAKITINKETLTIEHTDGTIIKFDAKADEGYEFVEWVGDINSGYQAVFKDPNQELQITFEAVVGTDKTTASTYTVDAGASFTVQLTKTQCKFTFTQAGESSTTTVTYKVTSIIKYASGFKYGTSTSDRSYTVSVSENTNFSVILTLKSYSIVFE